MKQPLLQTFIWKLMNCVNRKYIPEILKFTVISSVAYMKEKIYIISRNIILYVIGLTW